MTTVCITNLWGFLKLDKVCIYKEKLVFLIDKQARVFSYSHNL